MSSQPPSSRKGERHHGDTVVKRVSRKHDDDGHGGAWKVAFADFCLALMCLFLVMWVMAARNQERAQEAMQMTAASGGSALHEGQGARVEARLGGPSGSLIPREPMPGREAQAAQAEPADPALPRVRYESAGDLQALARLLARLGAEAGLAGNLQTVVTAQGLRVLLHDTARQGMFERGSWIPSERFRTLLRRMGPLFARMDNQLLIVGHTDSRQYADSGHAAFSNWTLSSHRAMAARSQLLAGGMPASSVLQVVGMADTAPLYPGDPAADVNRRIELLILTSAQAGNVAAMFGAPAAVQRLFDGADAVLSRGDREAALLQAQLAAGGREGATR